MTEGATEIYPGFREESAAHAERQRGLREAAAEPLPGPLMEAFAGLPEEVAGLRVRKMNHFDFVIFRMLKSPIVDQLSAAIERGKRSKQAGTDGKAAAAAEEKPVSLSDQDHDYALVYQFTRPVEASEAWLKSRNPKHAAADYRALARREIGMKLGVVEVAILIRMAHASVVEGFSSVLHFVPKETGGEQPVFTSPPADLKTGSAGGSTTSAG